MIEQELTADQFARDIPDEILGRIAELARVPDAERVQFYMALRSAIGMFRERDRRTRLALNSRLDSFASAAEELRKKLLNLNDDQRTWLDEVLERGLSIELMIAPCEGPGGWHGAPIRSACINDLDAMLTSLVVAMSGPWVRQKSRSPGYPGGARPTGESFQLFIKWFLRDVRLSHGKIGLERLDRVLELLRPYAPQAIPKAPSRTTLRRLMRGAKNS